MHPESTPTPARYAKGKTCADCGIPVSTHSTGRCKKCAARQRPSRPLGTCLDCGKTLARSRVSVRCRPCASRASLASSAAKTAAFQKSRDRAREQAKPPPTCIDCGKIVSWTSTGRCHSCAQAEKWKRPEYRAAFTGMTGRSLSPETRAKKSAALKGRPQPNGQAEAQRATKLAKGSWSEIGTIQVRKGKRGDYAFIKVSHGKGNENWIQHHRWVMEQHLRRALDTNEHIHHIDGDSLNNSLDNLAVISARDHTLIMKLLICLDRALARTIVRTLLARFPRLLDD